MTADRRAAGTIEHLQQGPLAGQGDARRGIEDRPQRHRDRRIVASRGDADRALADRRNEIGGIQQPRRPIDQAEPLQARGSQDRRVDLAACKLGQARLDIAA